MIEVISLLWVAIAPQHPDSVRFANALKAVDDSLTGVRRTAAGLRTDLGSVSPALVFSRAGRQRTQCTGSRAAVTELQRVLGSRVYTPRAAAAQQALQAEAVAVRQALERCEREWAPQAGPPPGRADSLRAWAPHRLELLQRAIRRYELKAAAFRGSAGLK